MPCHVDEFPPQRGEIETLIKIIDGKISIKNVGDGFYGKYPTPREILKEAKKKYKTYHYKVQGSTMVIVSPCPKGC